MSGHVIHVFLLLIFGHVARGADLVIRIPGGGQPKDGYYRLDYRYVLLFGRFLNLCQPDIASPSLSSFAKKIFHVFDNESGSQERFNVTFCLILQQHEMKHHHS